MSKAPAANTDSAPTASSASCRKALGAYYTAAPVVDFLVTWGLGLGGGAVMDPSCGDGRFLVAAARQGATRLVGCDLDPDALRTAKATLSDAGAGADWHQGDFFLLAPERRAPFDLVVGNPPFIRYQHFSGETRARALASALRVGARLSRLSASWAPFLLHAMQFLRPGGAMGMVVPAELAQTAYGTETLRALCAGFASVRLLTFRRNWFDGAQQETFLLLAEDRGGATASAELVPLDRIEDLAGFALSAAGQDGFNLDTARGGRLGLAFVAPAARDLYLRLIDHADVVELCSLGEVANGYVSGANEFFHCTAADGAQRALPQEWLLPIARNSRSLMGLTFTQRDVAYAEARGVPHHLILPREDDLFAADSVALEAFQRAGERAGIPARYKCRTRNPWWRVPGLIRADVLLPYMIGSEPHASVNCANALYPNSLHGLRLANPMLAARVVLGLASSLSLLSMELVGRSYGGGILKLEPTEMQRVRLVLPTCGEQQLRMVFELADAALRDGDFNAVVEVADSLILKDQLGLSAEDIDCLSQARSALVERRLARSRRNRP
ncbi:methyltransferase domain-containing protein [Thiohalocapsa halophila]